MYKCNLFMSDFFEKQISNYCGLHALQNLFCNKNITPEHLNQIATNIAKESGDKIQNHAHTTGFWSFETLRRFVESQQNLTTFNHISQTNNSRSWVQHRRQDCIGYILHLPQQQHYVCARWTHNNFLQYVDSRNNGPILTTLPTIKNQCKNNKWNIFGVYGIPPTSSTSSG